MQAKRRERAERFGIKGSEQDFVLNEAQLADMREKLGVDIENAVHQRKFRLNAVHCYGVGEMSTYDVMQ